ncbi:hypothetical protein OSB04_un000303 [Centaurea solstitialis]|uniref:Reverse transcriptase zinc-binding domain-containing protein n=1 Tax=Centaurea solstitialis TaxID=347529 RepID=A0AA38SIE3_9ASTR|nr:hypothetical protein OSB04_un000303 [Centaurea solstitialis]
MAMGVSDLVRQFIRFQIGSGNMINAWEDNWFQGGPLSRLISYNRFHRAGFDRETNVHALTSQCQGVWPMEWTQSNPTGFMLPLPTTFPNRVDALKWVSNQQLVDFTVKEAWKSLSGIYPSYHWTKFVWFKGHIPKHGFCMWTACHGRLPTQDRIRTWKHDPPDFVCALCGSGPDSHSHSFFMCPFSLVVWSRIKVEVGLGGFPDDWNLLVDRLNDNQGPKRKIQKLALSGAVYFIWRERNRRLFTSVKMDSEQIFRQIRDVIISRMAWRSVASTRRDE